MLIVGKLVNRRRTIFDYPDLGGNCFSVQGQQSQTQPTVVCRHATERGDEIDKRLGRFPAC